jgi:integrase/recombinase XerD
MTHELTHIQTANLQAFLLSAAAISDNYRYHIREFVRFADEMETEELADAVAAYFRFLNKQRYAASTVRCKRQAVKDRLRREMAKPLYTDEQRTVFEYRIRELDRDPETKAPSGGGVTGANKTLSDEEYQKLMLRARSARQKRFMEFLWTTGARISEMCDIRVSDLALEGNVVSIRIRGKGNKRAAYKERTVYITKAMRDRIEETFSGSQYLFETRGGRPYNRSYVSNQIAKLTKHVLGRRLSAHKFRHSFATRKIKETGRYKAVSEYLGHSDVRITLRVYSHDAFSPEEVLGPEVVP